MSKMFDNYNKDSEVLPQNNCLLRECHPECFENINNVSNIRVLKNAKGVMIGVEADEGTTFTLSFVLVGDKEQKEAMIKENNFELTIYNDQYDEVLTIPALYSSKTKTVNALLHSEKDSTLKYGVYHMQLTSQVYFNKYIIFSTRDAILNID